jgi:hypothetical protein
MNSLLLEQAGHLQKTIAALDSEAYYWRLNGHLGRHSVALSVKLWGLALEIGSIARDARAIAADSVLDEEDVLADQLLAMQQAMRVCYEGFAPAAWPQLRWYHHFALWPVRALQRRIHRKLGALRVYILEHDADVPDGRESATFTDSKQLFDHLQRL